MKSVSCGWMKKCIMYCFIHNKLLSSSDEFVAAYLKIIKERMILLYLIIF